MGEPGIAAARPGTPSGVPGFRLSKKSFRPKIVYKTFSPAECRRAGKRNYLFSQEAVEKLRQRKK